MMRKISVVLCVVCVALGCSMSAPRGGSVRLSDYRPVPEERRSIPVTVSREELKMALAKGEIVNSIRIVEVFRRGGTNFPQYRLFDIRPGSVYELLKIENADILVAANDYVVFTPEQFRAFVKLMAKQNTPTIEVARHGKSILYEYNIVPPIVPQRPAVQ